MPERSQDGASRDNTLMHFYVRFPDTSVVHMLDPAARQNIQVYKFTTAQVYAVPSDPNAKVSGTQGTVSLRYGMNRFNTIVTAENGAEMHYPFRINVADAPTQPAPPSTPSSDATLAALTVKGSDASPDAEWTECPLNPAFAATEKYYIVSSGEYEEFKVVPEPADSKATYIINGTGGVIPSSDPIYGNNFPLTVTVTAEDGHTTQQYYLCLSRQVELNELELLENEGELALDHVPDTYTYNAEFTFSSDNKYKLLATSAWTSPTITAKLDGNDIALDTEFTLTETDHQIIITVVPYPSGPRACLTYTINLTKRDT